MNDFFFSDVALQVEAEEENLYLFHIVRISIASASKISIVHQETEQDGSLCARSHDR